MLSTGGALTHYPSPSEPTISIGKAGLRAFALILAQELGPHGVRVATITIAGIVAENTPLAPARVASAFFAAHRYQTKPGLLFDGKDSPSFQLT